jgi:hypothetical protein
MKQHSTRWRLRISDVQLSLLIADLKPFVCGALTVHMRVDSVSRLPWLSTNPQAEQFDESLLALWRRLNALTCLSEQRRYGLHLDLFEASVSVSSLRLGMRQRRTDPPSAIPSDAPTSRRRGKLLRRIENLRRRLKRILKAEAGLEGEAQFSRCFAEYRGPILAELFRRLPKWARLTGIKKRYSTIVDYGVRLAMEGLNDVGVRNPDVKDVRRLVKRFLAYTRRNRTGLSIRDFSTDPSHTKMRLATFIQRCWKKNASKAASRNVSKEKPWVNTKYRI